MCLLRSVGSFELGSSGWVVCGDCGVLMEVVVIGKFDGVLERVGFRGNDAFRIGCLKKFSVKRLTFYW